MAVQGDTFEKIQYKRHLSTVVPIYHFRQPARLNEAQLPFKLVLVSNMDMDGVIDIPVPMEQARDSWFEGFYWSVTVCHNCGSSSHLGWKFTSLSGAESFHALIVSSFEERQGETEGARSNPVADSILVGVEAPRWVAALLASYMVAK